MLDGISADLSDPKFVVNELEPVRQNGAIVRESVLATRARAAAAAAEQQLLLNALGPAPVDDEPPEDPAVAAERSLITARLAQYDGRVRRCDVILARTDELVRRALEAHGAAVFDILNDRTVSPLRPAVLMASVAQLRDRFGELIEIAAQSLRAIDFRRDWTTPLTAFGGFLLLVLVVVLPLRRWLIRAHGPQLGVEAPSATRRFQAAVSMVVANAMLPALAIAGLMLALSQTSATSSDLALFFDFALETALYVVPLVGLTFAVVAPGPPAWRITKFTDKSANRVSRAIGTYALIVLVITPILTAISPVYAEGGFIEVVGLRQELSAPMSLIGVVLYGLATLNLVLPSNWRFRIARQGTTATDDRRPKLFARAVMVLCAVGVVLSMILGAVGYLNLSIFLEVSITWTLVTLGCALGLRVLASEGLRVAITAENQVGAWLRQRLVLDEAAADRLVFWLTLLLDVVGVMCVAAVI
ncbi:MAG: hypothetical protein OET79_09320, partial [Nitrospirota bacterium]|nr:hypothetical protein [Nitrospirota bacterium]